MCSAGARLESLLMTPDEYRRALSEMSDSSYDAFKRRWGGAANKSRDEAVAEFAYSGEPDRWDRIAVMHLRSLGVPWVQTEEEKAGGLAERNTKAAEASAAAAAESAKLARRAVRVSWYAVVVALLGSVITIALARGC